MALHDRLEPIEIPGAAAAQALGRTLALAPHPDDETIGCGGLLALLAHAGAAVHVVLVSDGAASHPRSRSHPPHLLAELRRQEMTDALLELGCDKQQLTVLGLPDGAVTAPGGDLYHAAFEALAGVARDFRPDTVVLPWRHDDHADHRASQALGEAVCRQVVPTARRLEYVVWPPSPGCAAQGIDSALAGIWNIDIAAVLGRKRRALLRHRTQLGQVVLDDPEGFTLPAPLLDACERSVETYYCFKPGGDHGSDS
jgi:LmbE family N-acetylglucosaminyl deacetylase